VDLDVRQSGNICTLKVKGPLKSGPPVDEFSQAIQSALGTGHIYIVLNLEAMPVLDSSGIGAIVNALRLAEKTFKMVGILNLFTVYATEGSAVTAFG
jgi:anti-anti-sigma factor